MRSLFIGAVLALVAAAPVAAAPIIERVCEANVIAQYKHLLSREQWLEVVEVGEASGQISESHAAQLRELIAAAYSTEDLSAWVQGLCPSGSKLEVTRAW